MAKENILRDYTVPSEHSGNQETFLHLFRKEHEKQKKKEIWSFLK